MAEKKRPWMARAMMPSLRPWYIYNVETGQKYYSCGVLSEEQADQLAYFANWLEREQSLDKQPGPVLLAQELLNRKRKDPSTSAFTEPSPEHPDVVRAQALSESTFEVGSMATHEELKVALDRGDHLVYAKLLLDGWAYIVEKFSEEVSQKDTSDDPIRQVRVKPLLEDARVIERKLDMLSGHSDERVDWKTVAATWEELHERAKRLVKALES